MNLSHRLDKVERIRGMQSRSFHLGLAFVTLSGAGLYVGVILHRFLVGITLVLLANWAFVWGLSLHRRARDLLKQHGKELP